MTYATSSVVADFLLPWINAMSEPASPDRTGAIEPVVLPDEAYEALLPLIKWARTLNCASPRGYRLGTYDDVRETYRLRTGDVRRIGELFDRRRELYENVKVVDVEARGGAATPAGADGQSVPRSRSQHRAHGPSSVEPEGTRASGANLTSGAMNNVPNRDAEHPSGATGRLYG